MAAVVFLCSNVSYAYETVHAVTEVPKEEATVKMNTQLTRYHNRDNQTSNFTRRIVEDKPETRIPNPFDAIMMKRIKDSNEQAAKDEGAEVEDIKIDSKELEYFDETGEVEARGDVVIYSKDGTVINADKAIYDKNANTIKLFDNIVLTKGSNRVCGDYMFIDLNEENALMDTPTAYAGSMIKMTAQEGYAYSDRIEAINGSVDLAKKIELALKTPGFNGYMDTLMLDEGSITFEEKRDKLSNYKIKTKEIVVYPQKDHDSIFLKNADIYYKKFRLLTVHSLELFTDKEMESRNVSIPIDIGSISDFGMYLGMGYVFKIPAGGSLKVSPIIALENSDFGVGALGELKVKDLDLKAAWASNSQNLVVEGDYRFNDKIRAEFGRHAYKDEWFNGSNRSGHLAQLVYQDDFNVKDIDATFTHRVTAGYVSDYRRKHQEDDNFGTSRFRYQMQLSKDLFGVSNKEQDMSLDIGVSAHAGATLYGTGDTAALFQAGPYINSRIKNWQSSLSYAVGGVHGDSPMWFDKYTYGRSSFYIRETLKLTKYLTLGYAGVLSPLKDNYERDLMTENKFFAVVGPDDVKVAFSYDTVRENAYIDFMFLLGTDSKGISFDKFTIKDPNKLKKKHTSIFTRDKGLNKIRVPDNL